MSAPVPARNRPAVTTRPVEPGDRAGWQALYEAYQLFYDRPGLPQGFYDTAFARLQSGDAKDFRGLVAEDGGRIVGLTHYVFHPHLWRPEGDCLQLCCALDLRVAKSRKTAAYELVGLINQRTWMGHFEVWAEDGEIVFRHSLALPMGERPTLAQAASMIDAAIEASDRYYPAFDFMVRGNKKPQEAIDACLFETVGTA